MQIVVNPKESFSLLLFVFSHDRLSFHWESAADA